MNLSTSSDRKTLRDLPAAAKLVVTAFLVAVGIGYFWAMVQLHFKHGGNGEPMPTVADTVAHFSGREWPLEDQPAPPPEPNNESSKTAPAFPAGQEPFAKVKSIIDARCKECHSKDGEKEEVPLVTYDDLSKFLKNGQLLKVLTGPRDKWSKNSMVQAFFEKSEENKKAWLARVEKEKGLEAEREAERLAVVAWIEAGAKADFYNQDAFPLPNRDEFKPLTKEFRAGHLVWFETPATPPKEGSPPPQPKPVNKRAEAKKKQASVESLTQSTHAHLLTFAVLWGSIGFLFAFTPLPAFIRCTVSPLVVIAQTIDIMCWWLARLEGIGPYFALTILATGGIVGLGLATQITLILFTMWDTKGKIALALLAGLFLGGFGLAYVKVIKPHLEEEKLLAAPKNS